LPDLDVEVAHVVAIELAVGANMLLERDAAVLQDLLDSAAALAVRSGVNDDFHRLTPRLSRELLYVQFILLMRSIEIVDIRGPILGLTGRAPAPRLTGNFVL
jgi:hypothetical protein